MAEKKIALITGAGGGIGAGIAKTLSKWEKTIPAQRIGTPNDIGKAVSYLASDNSSFLFGETLVVDGGGMA
jgi:NAD(P)-dependent dehydrogenase (short-subunit alcohol dehydrogenase family)